MGHYEIVDGVLLLNKPAGLTSNQALQRVRRMLRARKAGHTGSLDPAATGMLPLCFGEATKVCAFLLDADKTYRVTAQLGSATETGDATGTEIEWAEVPDLSPDDWQKLLESFLGETMQVPPMYSALKKDGKRLYELARKGKTIEREPRPIRIDEIELLESAGKRLVFRVRCSKGTYVRSLVEDIARKAGTVAHTARLHRESVGAFRAADMLDMTGLEAAAKAGPEDLREQLLPPDKALEGMPAIELDAESAPKFLAGQKVSAPEGSPKGLARVYGADTEFLGVGQLSKDNCLAPKRVFHAGEKNS
ncbi:MAG: tRNA pseudouridine(55) synthase TruB [Woeseiaceae bacterium]|nr:tRNA pseudouridine(55) synthase TruB [Woeseiaceae bacterium]NIP20912.1 tRNA pseudouridine(55) synthase TruB [Woeseiaceae bacterium]NIS89679.1 tRNA pseudouridine(55) synthase TruB [Woeseiaceae bacterium]